MGLIIYTSAEGDIKYVNATNDIPFLNTTGDTLLPWNPLSTGNLSFGKVRGLPSVFKTNCRDMATSETAQGIPRDTVLPNAVGIIHKQNFNANCAPRLNELDTADGALIYAGCDGQITIISPKNPDYVVRIGF